eukprot:gene5612-5850_t
MPHLQSDPSSPATGTSSPTILPRMSGPPRAPLPKPSMLSEKSRVKAVAAKISAARELARRLAEEKQAAVAAAARADALARQLKRVEGARSSSSSSLNRLKRENDALKTLLLELAADRQAAQARLVELQERMADLASVSVTGSMLGETAWDTESSAQDAEAESAQDVKASLVVIARPASSAARLNPIWQHMCWKPAGAADRQRVCCLDPFQGLADAASLHWPELIVLVSDVEG